MLFLINFAIATFAVLLLNKLLESQSCLFNFIFYADNLVCLSQKDIGYWPKFYSNIGVVQEFPYLYILKNVPIE